VPTGKPATAPLLLNERQDGCARQPACHLVRSRSL
jgi:hypothetical protein